MKRGPAKSGNKICLHLPVLHQNEHVLHLTQKCTEVPVKMYEKYTRV